MAETLTSGPGGRPVNPRTKLAALLWTASLVLFLPALPAFAFAALLLAAAAVVDRTLFLTVLRRSLAIAIPFTLAVVAVQTLLVRHADSAPLWGPFLFSDHGLEKSGALAGRVTAIVTTSLLVFTSTGPARLLRSLDTAGWPPALAYLIASPLLMLGAFAARLRAIREAQEARGWRRGGSPLHRLRGLLLLVSPLVTSALIEADQRSHVLNQRAFRAFPRRTPLLPVDDAPWERPARLALVGLAVLQAGAWPWL
ncbi:Cobalt transport protein [uncultured Pleomorphomonas sp.]|uniref:Cobalt transport protein n=1 Tax=uncultured Pleomorphomonas sp. TaxID=442121 RepID=A0A212LF18_9HYPH|nr:energy-coupling factor transporter transmembrane component T [uncultured Pleomorphomonas sp.]SCM75989.1 Cobalt transport protein [uncultured Pleomorphomonas sp.]